MLKRLILYIAIGLLGLTLAVSGCGGYGQHKSKPGGTTTRGGY